MSAAGVDAAGVNDDDLDALIHRVDLDALVRLIDDRSDAGDWDGLERVRTRARRAIDTGRQLWPAATLAAYRLVLHAPATHAAAVLNDPQGAERFALGPLTEVAAQHHRWDELAPTLDATPDAALVAHECALRGNTASVGALPDPLELPTRLGPWEPSYALATYRDHDASFPRPELPAPQHEIDPSTGAERLDDDIDAAIRQLVEPWTSASNGRAETACVVGTVADAIGALGARHARICALDARTAIAWLAWAGASGGAFGRRRGAATGRFGAWWVLAALGDRLDDWPVASDELGAIADQLTWYRWDAFEPDQGWSLQLAIEDRADGVAWAINATDAT